MRSDRSHHIMAKAPESLPACHFCTERDRTSPSLFPRGPAFADRRGSLSRKALLAHRCITGIYCIIAMSTVSPWRSALRRTVARCFEPWNIRKTVGEPQGLSKSPGRSLSQVRERERERAHRAGGPGGVFDVACQGGHGWRWCEPGQEPGTGLARE